MPNYPYSFQLPPLNVQDIPNNGAVGEFLGISAGGVLDWLPVASGGGDMLKSENLSGLASYPTARTNLGLGTGDSPTFKNLTISTGTITTSAPVTISQTWNGTGSTVFKALVVNATTPGTTSSASSLLLDLQVGGVSQFYVDKSGTLRMRPLDAETKMAYSAAGFLFYGSGAPSLFIGQDGTGAGNAVMSSTGFIGFASTSVAASGNSDTRLYRDGAANTLALRNGAAAQTFRVYNTSPGTGNNEYAEIAWVGNFLLIRPAASGTATVRGSVFGSGSSETYLDGSVTNFRSTSLIRWSINSSGHFVAGADNTYDIGASGANRPRNVYVGTSLFTGVGGINFDINARLRSPATDVITLYNNGLSDFNRLQFGGTTASFPAIKRSSTTLQARLADDSAFAPIQGKLTTDTAYTGTTVVPTGFITLYDSIGTAYKVPCVAA
jgi:hypothetical protein